MHSMDLAAVASRGVAPTGEGNTPQRGRFAVALSTIATIAAALALLTSCGHAEDTRTVGPYTLALTDTTKPALGDPGGQGAVYETQVAIALPLTDPPALEGAGSRPYPRPVWYTSNDLRVQLQYVITNFEDKEIVVELMVDGWNEFIRYSPTVSVDEEGNVNADRAMVDRIIIVPAKSRVTGTVSYDDFERAALSLATIMNGAANPFHVVEPHTNILSDPATAPFVPSVIDGITGFDLSLRSSTAVKVAVEATVELIDHGDHLVANGAPFTARPPRRYHPVLPKPPM